MSDNNIKKSLEEELKAIESDPMFSSAFRTRKITAYLFRTAVMIAFYVYFWEYEWVRWTLLLYVPLNLFALFFIFGSKRMLDKKLQQIRERIDSLDTPSNGANTN